MTYENILSKIENSIETIEINRPSKLNALNLKTIQELRFVLETALNNNAVKAIIITGNGEKAFVAGADIAEFANFNSKQGEELAANGHQLLFDYIENFSKPIIAAINGFALGGGLELAMACHFRIASDNAKMGLPEVSLGVIPGYGGTQRLPQLVGKGRAMEMILTATMITAAEAYRTGLVNHVVPQTELILFAKTIADKIIRNAPTAIIKAIASVNAGYKTGENGFQTEINNFGKCFETADFIEGTTAFLEKRKPKF